MQLSYYINQLIDKNNRSYSAVIKLFDRIKNIPSSRLKTISIFVVIVLLVSLFIVIYPRLYANQDYRSRATSTGVTTSLFPATKNVKAGDEFPVEVRMDTSIDTVTAANIVLNYDPSSVEIKHFTSVDPLPVVLSPIKNNNGTSSVAVGARLNSPFRGFSPIGIFTVKILKTKNSELSISSSTQIAALGKDGNALSSSSGLKLTTTSRISLPSLIYPKYNGLQLVTKTLPNIQSNRPYSVSIELTKPNNINPDIVVHNLPSGIRQAPCIQIESKTKLQCVINGTTSEVGIHKIDIVATGRGYLGLTGSITLVVTH